MRTNAKITESGENADANTALPGPGQSTAASLLDRLPFAERRSQFIQKLAQLTFSQKSYLLAFIVFLLVVDENYVESDNIRLVGVLAGIGLARELWHLFQRIWSQMLGKGLLLVLYAATANFAVALSAMKINAIAGIEPTPFVFTLGFATLLMLPFWLISASMVFLSIALVMTNIWLLISIVLRLVRIKVRVHWEDKSFVFLTMFMRLILIPSVLATLMSVLSPYANQIDVFGAGNARIHIVDPTTLTEQDRALLQNATDEQALEILQQIQQRNAEQEKSLTLTPEGTSTAAIEDQKPGDVTGSDDNESQSPEEPEQVRYLDTMIANFIFWFETYPNSTCQKTPEQRSLVIDENSVFLAQRDDSELGYAFSVQACIPRYQMDDVIPSPE